MTFCGGVYIKINIFFDNMVDFNLCVVKSFTGFLKTLVDLVPRRLFSAGLSWEMAPLRSMRMIFGILLLVPSISASKTPDRPRGVAKSSLSAHLLVAHRAEAHLYNPKDDGTWQCLDGSNVILFEQINDVSIVFSR